MQKVRYGLIYKGNRKYLDPQYLRYKLLSKQNDYEFLKKFTHYYRNSYINCGIINQLMIIAETNINKNNSLLINEFFENELYQWDKKTKNQKLKYKSLHDLATFVMNYDSNIEKAKIEQNQNENLEKPTINHQHQLTLNEINDSVKTKKKSKTPIDGQLSLF